MLKAADLATSPGDRLASFAESAVPVAEMKGLWIVTTEASAEPTRRDFLYIATGAVAAVGAAAAVWPFISQMNPDASTIAAGAPIEVDLTPIAEGQDIKVFWRGQPIYIMNRTKKQVEEARNTPLSDLKDPQTDQARTKEGHENWLVVVGICTHLGCIPIAHEGKYDGFFCPCHVRSTTAPVVSARGRRRSTCRFLPTNSSPTPKSRSADVPVRRTNAY